MNRLRHVLICAVLAAALLLPRLPALDGFATGDEPYWLSMGANFYYALGQREFHNTVYEYQPAVTTMWVVTAAMLSYYPEYRGLGQGYLEFEKGLLDPFLLQHGRDPLELLREARLMQVLLVTGLMLAVYALLQRMIGTGPSLAAVLLAGFDPFFLGQSRLLDHEALLALFSAISVLALLVYALQGRRPIFLILSGVSAGLAQLTKSSGVALLLPVGLILLLLWARERNAGSPHARAALQSGRALGVWLTVLAATYFILWPGMWVAPGKMLYHVYGNAFSYAFQGARLIALDETASPPLSLDTDLRGVAGLTYGILWRTTPLTWIGVLLGLALAVARGRAPVPALTHWTGLSMLALATAIILLFGLAHGRNSPHYALTSYLALNVFAGLGWHYTLEWIGAAVSVLRPILARALVLAAVLAAQAGSAAAAYPYFFTYENPSLAWPRRSEYPQFAYGEGLELAAQYLSGLPGAHEQTALAYYSRGCFSYFYLGQTERFKPYYADPGHEADLKAALDSADYLVLYYAIQGRADRYAALWAALVAVQPEHEVWLNGYKYAVIYRIETLPPAVVADLTSE